jgi:KipI family sensor histidine kinase inhibitor
MVDKTSVERVGERAVVLRVDDPPSRELTQHLAGLAEAARAIDAVIDAVPGHRTLLLEVEPSSAKALLEMVRGLVATGRPHPGETHSLVAIYDGPDLKWVLERLEISLEELIALHSEPSYDVRMLGSPRFIYLSEVNDRLALPRMDNPRLEVPAGSVGIGGRQTGIYGRARPGGWRIIGRVIELPEVRPGDRVKFVSQ